MCCKMEANELRLAFVPVAEAIFRALGMTLGCHRLELVAIDGRLVEVLAPRRARQAPALPTPRSSTCGSSGYRVARFQASLIRESMTHPLTRVWSWGYRGVSLARRAPSLALKEPSKPPWRERRTPRKSLLGSPRIFPVFQVVIVFAAKANHVLTTGLTHHPRKAANEEETANRPRLVNCEGPVAANWASRL